MVLIFSLNLVPRAAAGEALGIARAMARRVIMPVADFRQSQDVARRAVERPLWRSSGPPMGGREGTWNLAVLVGLLVTAGAALRAFAVPPGVGDVDSVNFARALDGFDPLRQAPHFPGYPVFVAAAQAFRAAGVGSDVWALALPGIVVWVLAAPVAFVGLRRWLGEGAALGVLVTTAVAPGAVVVSAWPASDGLGLSLVVLAAGLVGLAHTQTGPGSDRARLAAAVVLGLLLGVRASWWPVAVAGLALLVLGRVYGTRRSVRFDVRAGRVRADRERAVIGTAAAPAVAPGVVPVVAPVVAPVAAAFLAGTLVWLVPLAVSVGPAALLELGAGFVRGHLLEWGHTAWATTLDPAASAPVVGPDLAARIARAAWGLWDAGLGAAWPAFVPGSDELGTRTGPAVAVATLAGAGLAMAAVRCLERRPVWRTELKRTRSRIVPDGSRDGRTHAGRLESLTLLESYSTYGEERVLYARRRPQMGVLATGAKPVGVLGARERSGALRWSARPAGALLLVLVLAAPYTAWLVGFQNVAKTRHLLPLLPVVGALVLAAVPRPRVGAVVLAAALALVTLPRAGQQGREPSPALAMVEHLVRSSSPAGLLVFAGEEARVFEHTAPYLRVLRPAGPDVLAAEAHRAAARGVRVLVSSGTPGIEALASYLRPVPGARFSAPVTVRPHDTELVLYEYELASPRSEVKP